MKTIKIEGIATIGNRTFSFDSGLPGGEPVLNAEQSLHGRMILKRNGSAQFQDNGRIFLPPQWHDVCSGNNYYVKRTSRHYIIQIKVPVVQKRTETQDTLDSIIPAVMGDITLDRKEVLDV